MSVTVAQIKSNAFLAKGAIHHAMALFTTHWGQMLQAAGEEACQANDRAEHWRGVYELMDGTGHEGVDNKGDFTNANPEQVMNDIDAIKTELTGYRAVWDDFTPTKAMALLDQVDTALGEADGFIQACLPQDIEADGDGTEDAPEGTDDPGTGEGGGAREETTPDP